MKDWMLVVLLVFILFGIACAIGNDLRAKSKEHERLMEQCMEFRPEYECFVLLGGKP